MNVRPPALLPVVAVGALLMWLLLPLASGVPAFRDAGHFYYPLFKYCRQEWAAGRIPLWNPYENLGQPLLADGTSSVLYPGKLLFALPLPYWTAFNAYLALHLLLAAVGAYWFARKLPASVGASTLAALSYAGGGIVLFDVHNAVFLVGAAWLPWAMRAAEVMLRKRSLRATLAFGAALAMMVLGGDPQIACTAGLLVLLRWITLWRRRTNRGGAGGGPTDDLHTPAVRQWLRVCASVLRRLGAAGRSALSGRFVPDLSNRAGQASSGTRRGWLAGVARRRGALLLIAGLVAFLLAAVQILPSYEFARRSSRRPGSLSERFLANPPPDSHLAHAYHFSVGPWRWAEFLWPNLFGRQFPEHRRWIDALPAEGRAWTPSLYQGLLPITCALGAMKLRDRRRRSSRGCLSRQRWLTLSAALAILAALGWYGLGWLAVELQLLPGGAESRQTSVGPPFGGLYWLMSLLLPGYGMFRFPSKLLVIAAWALSGLAALGFDDLVRGRSRAAPRLWIGLAILSGLGVLAAICGRGAFLAVMENTSPNELFGPLDARGAWWDLTLALSQSLVLALSLWRLFASPLFRRRIAGMRMHVAAALLLTVFDLGLAGRWMIATVSAANFEGTNGTAAVVRNWAADAVVPPRVYRPGYLAAERWRDRGDGRRLAEAVTWDRAVLMPKHNLTDRIAAGPAAGTMSLASFDEWRMRESIAGHSRWLAQCDAAILPADARPPYRDRLADGESSRF
ncbi:MAG: hypothetical protein ACOY3P_21315, partial [Planctomycetota bacterium]